MDGVRDRGTILVFRRDWALSKLLSYLSLLVF
jgi:hypothetical protein